MERPQLWNIETMTTQATKDTFYEKLSQLEGGANYANVKAVFLEMMIALLPEGALETKAKIYQRAQQVKELLREFLAAHPVEGDEKIPVVCHSQLIASVTADGIEDEGTPQERFTNFIWTANAEVLPVDL